MLLPRTLLACLLPALAGWQVRPFRLSTEDRRLPVFALEPLPGRGLLVIDGFEQLGFLTRLRLKRRGGGLLVSAHRSAGLPTLLRTDVTAESATAVIARLVPPGGGWVLDGYDPSARLAAHRGSLRAVLFELYDRWEAGRGLRLEV